MTPVVLWVWLAYACGVGSEVFGKLRSLQMTPRQIYEADEEKLRPVLGRCTALDRLTDKDMGKAEKTVEFCVARHIGILCYDDEAYPQLLRKIENPPPVLYYIGEIIPDFDSLMTVATVGTRQPSSYGRRMAFSLACEWAKAGAVIVSGMALGIDSIAHAAALHSGAITVAVLGCGVDVVYPSVHEKLYRAITASGIIISEYPPGTKPRPYFFPQRNRLISGISRAVVVIEGKIHSGSLITADIALSQGREVYALPGNADEERSADPISLLRRGAHPLYGAQDLISDHLKLFHTERQFEKILPEQINDILTVYGVHMKDERKRKSVKGKVQKKALIPPQTESLSKPELHLDEQTLSVYKRIPENGQTCLPDSLTDEKTGMMAVLRALTMLELAALIIRFPSGKVCRVSADQENIVQF